MMINVNGGRRALSRFLWVVMMLILAGGMSGCATTSDPDPFESMNRSIYQFNDAIDRNALKPTAQFYRDVTPHWFRQSANRFFDNLSEPYSAINNLLQFQFANAGRNIGRFLINSTLGLLGLFDVAGDDLKITSTREDFGQTLGAWGIGSGAYLVLPLFGPTNIRDTVSRFGVDNRWNLLANRFSGHGKGYYAMQIFGAIRARERWLDADNMAQGLSLDPYVLYRSFSIQYRNNQVFNGQAPKAVEDESWLDEK